MTRLMLSLFAALTIANQAFARADVRIRTVFGDDNGDVAASIFYDSRAQAVKSIAMNGDVSTTPFVLGATGVTLFIDSATPANAIRGLIVMCPGCTGASVYADVLIAGEASATGYAMRTITEGRGIGVTRESPLVLSPGSVYIQNSLGTTLFLTAHPVDGVSYGDVRGILRGTITVIRGE